MKFATIAMPFMLGCTLLLPATLPAQEAETTSKDPVVITVNGTEITESEILNEIARIAQEVMQRNPQGINPAMLQQRNITFYEPARERSVRRALAIQLAEEKDMTPTEEEVAERFEGIKSRFESEEEFQKTLDERNTTAEEIEEMIKVEILYRDVVQAEVPMAATPSLEEMQTFYDENQQLFEQPEQVTASHILLRRDPEMSLDEQNELKEKLEGIKKEIADGSVEFADAAREHSEDPGSGQRGGSLGAFGRGQMVAPFENAAFATPVGEMSDIVESQFGYHLILVEDKQEAGVVPLDDVTAQLASFLQARAYEESVNEFFQGLEADAEIVDAMTKEQWDARHAPQPPAQAQPGRIQLPDSVRNQN